MSRSSNLRFLIPSFLSGLFLVFGLQTGAIASPLPLIENGEWVNSEIQKQEENKDATCWTTVRQMDSYFSGKPLTTPALLLRIEVSKGILNRFWVQASLKTKKSTITDLQLRQILPKSIQKKLPKASRNAFADPNSPNFSVALKHYSRITENWRLISAIIMASVHESSRGDHDLALLKPMTKKALRTLASVGTLLSIDLMKQASVAAGEAHHDTIQLSDIKRAFVAYEKTLPKEKKGSGQNKRKRGAFDPTVVHNKLQDLTKQNIQGKIKSLKQWNKQVWTLDENKDDLLTIINKISPLPITTGALDIVLQEMYKMGVFFASGFYPQRQDLFHPGSYKNILEQPQYFEDTPAEEFLTLDWISNVSEQIFPKITKNNGDILLHRVQSPFSHKNEDAFENAHRLLGYECDAMRDTTIHWLTMKKVWDHPLAKPIDPFAAELVAERLSELGWFLIKTAAENAERVSYPLIDADLMKKIAFAPYFWIKTKNQTTNWKGQERKEKALSNYKKNAFKNISSKTRIALNMHPLAPKKYNHFFHTIGSGIAAGDFNNDGRPDLFLAGDGGNRLYKNVGKYKFKDVTEDLGLVDLKMNDARQALFVDVNNDGKLDLFVVHGDSPSKLFLQNKVGFFNDVSRQSDIRSNHQAVCATFFDYDNDGLLDLFIGHYGPSEDDHWLTKQLEKNAKKKIDPRLLAVFSKKAARTAGFIRLDGRNGQKSLLFHNEGNGQFKDVTEQSKLQTTGFTLASAAVDFNNDGYQDLYLANDYGYDEIFINQGNGTFKEKGREMGLNDRGAGMNVSFTDLNHDGYFDSYITGVDMFSKNMSFQLPTKEKGFTLDERILSTSFYLSGNKLFLNKEGKMGTPVEASFFEPGDNGWGWGATFFDYENDGDDDLYLTNGYFTGSIAENQANQLFLFDQNQFFRFKQSSDEAFQGNSRAVVAIDLTGTGKQDLVVSNLHDSPRILKNMNKLKNNWVKVKLEGTTSNRFGIGAVVAVHIKDQLPIYKQVSCGSGYLSQEDTTLSFGLAQATSISHIEVIWPGRKQQHIKGPLKANQTLTIKES
ncbi:MAG: hypothetical protein ACI9BD_000410 [Candidatus Marinamargulisbacteria bacterium]|jgi:hypothetical protein